MGTFKNREAMEFTCKPGEYIFRVLSFDKGISKGAKSAGDDQYKLKVLIEQPNVLVQAYLTDSENEALAAQCDCFLKCTSGGIEPPIGINEPWNFDADDARGTGARFVDLIGLRGWCYVGWEDRPKDAPATWEPKYNKVKTWLTNKPKLPRHVEPAVSDEPDWN